MDAWTFVFQWWRRFGTERVLHPTAHDVLMAAPGLGDYFRQVGVIPASRRGVSAALSAGRDVIIWPGGEVDAMRNWRRRDQAVLGGRKGFIRQAIRSGVPIVPLASVGGHDTVFVLSEGRWLANGLDRFTGLKKKLRGVTMPIVLGVPFGLTVETIPTHLPCRRRSAPSCSSDSRRQGPGEGRRSGLRRLDLRRGGVRHPARHGSARQAAALSDLRLTGKGEQHAYDQRHRRSEGSRGGGPRSQRLARGHAGRDRRVRRVDRRPPVDPRRPRAREGDAVRGDHRARLLHALAEPTFMDEIFTSRASPSRSTTASTRCASPRRCRSATGSGCARAAAVEDVAGRRSDEVELTFELEGGDKPVCVAETLSRAYAG